jgi:hypothetical protein
VHDDTHDERDNGKALHRLTRIRRENPAFNYGFFRPNPLAFQGQAGKNAGHGRDSTGPSSPEQAEIARLSARSPTRRLLRGSSTPLGMTGGGTEMPARLSGA